MFRVKKRTTNFTNNLKLMKITPRYIHLTIWPVLKKNPWIIIIWKATKLKKIDQGLIQLQRLNKLFPNIIHHICHSCVRNVKAIGNLRAAKLIWKRKIRAKNSSSHMRSRNLQQMEITLISSHIVTYLFFLVSFSVLVNKNIHACSLYKYFRCFLNDRVGGFCKLTILERG